MVSFIKLIRLRIMRTISWLQTLQSLLLAATISCLWRVSWASGLRWLFFGHLVPKTEIVFSPSQRGAFYLGYQMQYPYQVCPFWSGWPRLYWSGRFDNPKVMWSFGLNAGHHFHITCSSHKNGHDSFGRFSFLHGYATVGPFLML